MKAFVTGGTGFIGGHLARRLLEQGHEVTVLARSEEKAAALKAAGATIVIGDITDRPSMKAGMAGSDVVFHVAAWYKLGGRDRHMAESINVEGTRNVLELAHELGVPKVVYTSTLAVFGDTTGEALESVNESYRMKGSEFLTEYDRTKWKAHYEVALPLIEQGYPIVIVMPGAVYGPGDTSLVGQLMQAYSHGLLVLFPGPETVLTYAHVDDIVDAHLLAAEKGRLGEAYIVTGEPHSLKEMVELWSRVTGKALPLAYVPARMIHPLAPLAEFLAKYLPMPELLSADGVRVLGASYVGFPAKAHQELGWGTRSLEDGLKETFDWLADKRAADRSASRSAAPQAPVDRRTAGMALLAAFGLLTLWLLRRRHK